MTIRVERLRDNASQARAMAAVCCDKTLRRQLLQIAHHYDSMAELQQRHDELVWLGPKRR
jgi:hypothetical protein